MLEIWLPLLHYLFSPDELLTYFNENQGPDHLVCHVLTKNQTAQGGLKKM